MSGIFTHQWHLIAPAGAGYAHQARQSFRFREHSAPTQPTPIQADAIGPAMEGRDVLACAMTGSGKTAAFLLHILQRLKDLPRGTTRALILTPTRELAAQIEAHRSELSKYTNMTGTGVFGGVGAGPQEKAFRKGVDIIVATPGGLLDHFQHDYAKLSGLDILVIDRLDHSRGSTGGRIRVHRGLVQSQAPPLEPRLSEPGRV